MGKFSDLPLHLLNDYFDGAISTGEENTNITDSYLQGGKSSITADGGYWTKMWIKVEEISEEVPEYPGFVEYKFKAQSPFREGDNFLFDIGALVTLAASANGTFEHGAKVYFKKGSYMYEWLVKNSSDYELYFNTNKTWLYFGRIYPIGSKDTDEYYIIFDGMKNYVMNALPRHQRTDNLAVFMELYFDKEYQKIYNMMKNVFSLLDAREVSTNWIEYLTKMYGVDLNNSELTGMELREWVENLVYLLRRKGTYTSLYIIWKTLLNNTTNKLNVYERWHPDLTGISDIPLGNFTDYLYQNAYDSFEPSGCSGEYWDHRNEVIPDYELGGDILSTHYKVEMDLSCQPLDDGDDTPAILSEATVDMLIENWELMRPVTRFSHYHELISPITDFTGQEIPLYYSLYDAFLSTRFTPSGDELLPGSGSDVMIYSEPTNLGTWEISHNLNENNWLVQCYNSDNERVWPKDAYATGLYSFVIEFDEPIAGHAVFAKAVAPDGDIYTQNVSLDEWPVVHTLGTKEVIVQFDDTTNYKMVPSGVVLNAIDDLTATWESSIDGSALLSDYDYTEVQALPTITEWVITHSLDVDTVLLLVYDNDDKLVIPDSITLNSRDACTITFSEAFTGYVVIRGISKSIVEEDVMDNLGDWIIGSGTSYDHDPISNNNVETPLLSGTEFTVIKDDVYGYYYVDFEVDDIMCDGEDWDITEILLRSTEGIPRFYSYFSPIHKPKDVWFNVHMRIVKS